MDGIILIDKPSGITSFDVLRVLRRKLKVKKMGHAGTLDPRATGLLIVGIGAGTKKLRGFLGLDKVYVMDVLLGIRTDTGDMDGKPVEEAEVKGFREEELLGVLKGLEGEVDLPVPLYSAVKHNGIPFYEYARKGIKIEPRVRASNIISLRLVSHAPDGPHYSLRIEMNCSKGTYARAVAEEIGSRLKVPATLKSLVRTRIGSFTLAQAKKLEEL